MIYETGRQAEYGILLSLLLTTAAAMLPSYITAIKEHRRTVKFVKESRTRSKRMIEELSAAGYHDIAEELGNINAGYPLPD